MEILKEHTEQLKVVLAKYGKENQVMIAVEEMAELSKELLKNINRDKKNEQEIVEEVADVYILLEQIKRIYNISEEQLSKSAAEKYYRWQKRLFS